jgi:hypothetical protein
MLEDFQNYHTARDPDAREWMECSVFAIAVPAAYLVAVAIAVAVALIVPDEVAPQQQTAVAARGAAR